MKIVYVILHYNTIKDTIECVNSIVHTQKKGTFEIVIVDNKSPNGSGNELLKKYSMENYIHIILNDENAGFARGNNIGFSYAKYKLTADFIVMINNDILLLQDSFQTDIVEEYKKNHYAVLGPLIITPQGESDANPGNNNLPSLKSLYSYQVRLYVLLFLNYLYLDGLYKFIKKRITKSNIRRPSKIHIENIQLHGCCWIFSPTFIKLFNGINDQTFLYREEELLFLQLKRNNLKSLFSPKIKIFHKEDSATQSITLKKHEKRRFLYLQYIRSTWILIKEIKRPF